MLGVTIKSFFMWSIDRVTVEFLNSQSGFHLASKHTSGLTASSKILEGMSIICKTELNKIRQVMFAAEFLY